MKIRNFISVLFLSGIIPVLSGQEIERNVALEIAEKFIEDRGNEHSVTSADNIMFDSRNVAFRINLMPQGFVIVSADQRVRPVLAYSFINDYQKKLNEREAADFYLLRLTEAYYDLDNIPLYVSNKWKYYLSEVRDKSHFEQWPPQGTTTTGGWLEENWTQSFPYNSMCPMDHNSGNRSIAGCPAVAMASILNYNGQTNEVQFTDNDDYYHSYGSGNQYWIDDDYEQRDFPSFTELNEYILALQDKYNRGETPTQNEVAALNFACGVACKQVYSSSISGTYGIEQAYTAYQRFGFDSARLVYDTDTTLNQQLSENMKIALPAHIGLVDPGHTVGHNLIVDGYNTDEYYHFNFGWGGNSNGWYTMPPTNIPYNLTVIEGLILDINKEGIYVGFQEESTRSPLINISPVPVSEVICIESNGFIAGDKIRIYSLCGELFDKIKVENACTVINYELSHYPGGIYFIEYISGNNRYVTKVMKQ